MKGEDPLLPGTLLLSVIAMLSVDEWPMAKKRELLRLKNLRTKQKTQIKWFEEQGSVTITADLGTSREVKILVVLLVSETDKVEKFTGADMVAY